MVCKSPPLKAWTARGVGEVKSRLDVELTTRRALSYLSGRAVLYCVYCILYRLRDFKFVIVFKLHYFPATFTKPLAVGGVGGEGKGQIEIPQPYTVYSSIHHI